MPVDGGREEQMSEVGGSAERVAAPVHRLRAVMAERATAAGPAWCGECDERTRRVELPDGSIRWCRSCHPVGVAL